jgi:hypothetical protein
MSHEDCDITFSFNKASIADPTIPPWTIKAKGQTFYCNHVTANAPWSTKETPDNPHTKGSIKFRHCDLVIDTDNCAIITQTQGKKD